MSSGLNRVPLLLTDMTWQEKQQQCNYLLYKCITLFSMNIY